MKTAVLLCGHLRSWDVCKNEFVNRFPDSDVFVHTYNNVMEYHPFIANQINATNNSVKLTTDDIIKKIGLNTKCVVVEDQDDIKIPDDILINNDIYSQYRKFKLCDQLRKDHEILNGFKYDLIIKTRFDIEYSVNLCSIINHITRDDKIYISSGPSEYPCDQVFIGNSKMISWLSENLMDMDGDNKYESPHDWVIYKAGQHLSQIQNLSTRVVRLKTFC
jgi:hypothetical protein